MKNLTLLLALVTLCVTLYGQAPTTAATAPVFSAIEGNTITLSWTNGNGNGRIVVAKAGAASQYEPSSGGPIMLGGVDANFGLGYDVSSDNSGEYIVYDGNGNNVTITNLEHSTTYYFEVFEYNSFGMFGSASYLTTTTLTASQSTLSPPTTGSSAAVSSKPTSTSMTLNWTSGNGANRLVVVKQGSAVTGGDAQYFTYTANAVFGSGDQLSAGLFAVYNGEYVVYNGTGNTVTVTGLVAGQTYYYKIIEYNGNFGPVYNDGAGLAGSVPAGTPLPLTWVAFTGKKLSAGIELKWTTVMEKDTRSFVVERSTNGRNFSSIATIMARGAATNHYHYQDVATPQTVYYRLKQVDNDGQYEYSKIITIQPPAYKSISVFPNPATEKIYIPLTEKATIKVFDETGRLITMKSVLPAESVEVSHLNTGTYLLEITESGKTYTTRFVKK